MQEALDELLQKGTKHGSKRTTLVIAHRLTTTKHCDTIKAAEIHLAEACGSPGAPLKEKTKGHAGYVATLKALYISRAGKPVPPTWNNKPGADRGESKLLREVRAALRENEATRLPMTPQRL